MTAYFFHFLGKLRHLTRGIGIRLLLTFVVVLMMTIIAAAAAWVAFDQQSDTIQRMSLSQVPSLNATAKLSYYSLRLTGSAPKLWSASTESERLLAINELKSYSQKFRVLAKEYHSLEKQQTFIDNIQSTINAIEINIDSLNSNVQQRLAIKNTNIGIINQLRSLHINFIAEIEPILNDSAFNVNSIINRLENEKNNRQLLDAIRFEDRQREAALTLYANINMAVGLISSSSNQPSLFELKQILYSLDELNIAIKVNVDSLSDFDSSITIRQMANEINHFISAEENAIDLRIRELHQLTEGERLLNENQILVGKLNRLLDQKNEANDQAIQSAIQKTAATITNNKTILLSLSFSSLLISFLVIWFYIKNSVIHRLNHAIHAIKTLASGDLNISISSTGLDEIAEIEAAVAVLRDAAKRRLETELQLREGQKNLLQAEKLVVLGRLSAEVAHEINQPLSAIRSYVHNANTFLQQDNIKDSQKALTKIKPLIERITKMTSQLRGLSRFPLMTLSSTNIAQVVDNALLLFEYRFKDAQINKRIDIPNNIYIEAEASRLEQVFINLISNALDAMKNTTSKTLSIRAQQSDNKSHNNCTITISDTGKGILLEESNKIFDSFFTTKQMGEGVGLGLSIAKSIVEDFNGQLSIYSTSAEGTTLQLVFPCVVELEKVIHE